MKLINYNQNKTMMRKLLFSSLMLFGIATTLPAQEVERTEPKFWIGVSGAANINLYTGTTQTLNSSIMVPAALHNGFGVGGFGALLLEYRPIPLIGLMLNLGYDNRGGSFDQTMSPCNCPEDLKTNLSYLTIQPSIRISPFGPNFYMFLGGAYSYNVTKSFTYTFDQNTGDLFTTSKGDFSHIRRDVFSGHIGVGYDIQLAAANSKNQVAISPFISYHPYFGQAPRDIESWSLSTVRIGLSLKIGSGKVKKAVNKPVSAVADTLAVAKAADTKALSTKQIDTKSVVVVENSHAKFVVRAPLSVPVKRTINEAFPLRNYIFFDKESSNIPSRYITLKPVEAKKFNPEQIDKTEAKNQVGRSARQMKAYYNILNILGYRMIENPKASITLTGASAGDGEALGKEYAESVKKYLVTAFGINESRIVTKGRNQPVNASELPGGKNYLTLLREGDRRVDIVTSPSNLLEPLQIVVEQADPIDSRILFNLESDETVSVKSWNIDVVDEKGVTQHYGPFTNKQQSISGNTILGNNAKGTYKLILTGETTDGKIIKKESDIRLVRNEEPKEEALRFSILFDFDQSNTVANYERFLKEDVAPHIANNGTVIIHGHTDIVGGTKYNMELSERRAEDVRQILKKAVDAAGKTGVRFEVLSFGMDEKNAPFENNSPEERFYNRTVIIDIVQPK